ncbi:hypothetical protein BDD12DRAFT_984833 [Trichophaea hybrida]|nr:hypothetical protein BDD12DRAFT_984833 [Trichophaea hybrida]
MGLPFEAIPGNAIGDPALGSNSTIQPGPSSAAKIENASGNTEGSHCYGPSLATVYWFIPVYQQIPVQTNSWLVQFEKLLMQNYTDILDYTVGLDRLVQFVDSNSWYYIVQYSFALDLVPVCTVARLAATENHNFQSLWTAAIKNLSPQENAILSDFGIELRAKGVVESLEGIRSEMKTAMTRNREGTWKVKFGGEEIVMRDIRMKILQWIDKFMQIGDIIVQYDPAHAALPWAAFRSLLMICLDKETTDIIIIGLERTACIIDRCAVYELLYLGVETPASKNWRKYCSSSTPQS